MSGGWADSSTVFNYLADPGSEHSSDFVRACADLSYVPRRIELDPESWPVDPPVVFFDSRECRLARRLRRSLDGRCEVIALAILASDAGIDPVLERHFADYLRWPAGRDELAFRLHRACVALEPECDGLTRELLMRCNLVGGSPSFLRSIERLRRLAACDAHILIRGETGTGKELAARAVHYSSQRSEGPFIPVNCAALPESLLENELFGHERGAYTDARSSEPGLVALADGGTLFLDEVNTLSAQGQAVLLRFLQDGRYRPLGGHRERSVDVRIVAATNQDLDELVQDGRFRDDLRYRLEVLTCDLPALRDRAGDALLLARHFVRRYCSRYGTDQKSLHPEFADRIAGDTWPGNVRELENCVHQAVLLSRDRHFVNVEDDDPANETAFPDPASTPNFKEAKDRVIREFEMKYLTELMQRTRGNVTQAARMAGKERRALGKLLKKHGIIVSNSP